jgi:hypothetical protein
MYSKQSYSDEIEIVVHHPYYPESPFTFTFPKRLPQSAVAAETCFLGLKEDALADEHRRALIETVAEMVTTAPQGFDDFPNEDAPTGSLAARFIAYFDDPSQIELEQILVSAWRAYRAAGIPTAYSKSISLNGKADGQSSDANQ